MNIKATFMLTLFTLLTAQAIHACHKRASNIDYDKLRKEVDQFTKEHQKEMAFIDALNNDDEFAAQKLLQEIDVNTKDYRGIPLIMTVVNRGNINILNKFVVHPDLKIDQLNKNGENVILYLIITGLLCKKNRPYNTKEIIMVMLLLYGASTSIKDNNGNSFDKALEAHVWVRTACQEYFKTLNKLRSCGMLPEPD